MLTDPTAGVYAATGLLPRKRISIPPAMYAAALRNLTVTFRSAPVPSSRRTVVGARDHVGIPVPAEPGFDWTWLTRTGASFDSAIVESPPVALGGPPHELADGWLALTASQAPASSDPNGRDQP
jgi:hypothetical protein